ncbi:MAG: RNA polymerase sigma factor [Bacteroidota bacterium]
MDELALIQRCQAGEMDAFEELLGRYEGLVYNLTHRYFGSQAEAADVAQEAMLKVFRRISEFKGHSSFKTWLYRVVTNLCLDTLRKHRTPPLSLDELEEDGKTLPDLPSKGEDPEGALEQAELRGILGDLLATLAEDHRIIIVLRDVEGLAYEEIAAILGCSLGTVKSRLARAREALRRRFLASPRTKGWLEGRLQA